MIAFPIAAVAIMVAGCAYGVYEWNRFQRNHPPKK